MVGSPATNKSPKTKIRQHEAFACSNYRQEPDDDDDEVVEDGEENQDELGDHWRKCFDEPSLGDVPSGRIMCQ